MWSQPNSDLQYGTTYWNNDGGDHPIVVVDLPTALQAIQTIVEQGEGADPDKSKVPIEPAKPVFGQEEYSHYAKFKRISEGIDLIRDPGPSPRTPR